MNIFSNKYFEAFRRCHANRTIFLTNVTDKSLLYNLRQSCAYYVLLIENKIVKIYALYIVGTNM